MLTSLSKTTQLGCKKILKVCLVGANGNVGRLLALNLKFNKHVTDLSLYDMRSTAAIREDLSNIDTRPHVTGFGGGEEALIDALKYSNVVVIVACRNSKANTREAMFEANAEIMMKFMKATVKACHRNMPFIHIVTNPVNALVPLCAEYLREFNCYNQRKLIGSCSVDSMRARTFLGKLVNYDPSKIIVPVVGGHSDNSITPIISQSKPKFKLSEKDQQQLEDRIIHGGDEVINAMKSGGSAFLSMGYCVSKFCDSICRAINGDKNVVDVGYVAADVNELEFFACNFSMDDEGVRECHRLPPMTPYETKLYYKAVKDVQNNIDIAKSYFKKYKSENKLN